MKNICTNIRNFILDTLFPISCVSCGQEGIWLCESCFSKIELLSFQVCPKCEKLITEAGRLCDYCKKNSPALDNLAVATKYKANSISKLVHLYKYNFVEDLHVPLGRLIVKNMLRNNLPLPDLIIPVPLHKRRLRWRGFNQSELLATHVSENLTPGFSIPTISDLVIRQKYTPPQMKIGKYSKRRENIRNAFISNPAYDIRGKKILLIDDIATTGATLFECAQILKQNGAKKVIGAVIARQEFDQA